MATFPVNIAPGSGAGPIQPQEFYVQTITVTFLFLQPLESDWPLTPAPQPIDATWAWSYNLNLIGQDRLPTGSRTYDLPDRGPQPIQQTWIVNLLQNTLTPIGYPLTTFSQYDWPVPTPPFRIEQTWAWRYNLNLIGQDVLPTGEQSYVLVPSQVPPEQVQLHSWNWSYNLNLIGLDRLPTGKFVYDLPQTPLAYRPFSGADYRSWEWKYNQNLINKDQLPTGEQVYDLAPPQRPPEQTQLHSWQWSYNLNLIGQDRFPTGEQVSDLAPRDYPRGPPLWTWNYNLNLIGQDRLPTGEQTFDLTPRPYEYANQLRGWEWRYNLNLIGKDRLPFRQTDWPVPPPVTWYRDWAVFQLEELEFEIPAHQLDWPNPTQPFRIEQTVTVSYNLNLIGQDKLPTGDQSTALTVPEPLRSIDLRTWLQGFSPTLFIVPPIMPLRFFDQAWPLTPAAQQPERSITASYNPNLVGQDKMVTGQQTTDLPPRDFARLFQTWINTVNLALVTAPPDIHAQARQLDWPLARGAEPDWRRSWEWSYNKNLIAQDQLPFRQTDWPNPVTPALVKDWIQSTNIALLAIQRPFAQFDWPLASAAAQPERTTTASYNPNLIGQDRLPSGKNYYDLWPSGPQQPDRGFGVSFNLNLRGQDRLPNRQSDWPLSPAHVITPLQVMVAGMPFFYGLQPLSLPLSASRISDLAPFGPAPLLQASVYNYNQAFIPIPTAPTLILRTLMGTGL